MKRIALTLIIAATAFVSCSTIKKDYTVEVIAEYPHDVHAYTQGLFFHDGHFYESTGQCGKSNFREVNLETGEVIRKFDLPAEYFGEGSIILGDKLYYLTWESYKAFVYNAETWEMEGSYKYPREGWGLTTDGKQLIASDGSNKIYFLDENYKFIRKISVTLNEKPVRWLNELEWIDGKIWANIYMTDMIVIINPHNGKVESTIDCKGLLPDKLRKKDTDVLNGIAYDKANGKIYLTGKNWPRLYEIKLVKKN